MNEPFKKYKSICISDCHLGFKYSRSDLLANFLEYHDCDNLFMVGDILDIWEFQKKVKWRETDSIVVKNIIEKKRAGTNVVYITGNHDALLREFVGVLNIEGIEFFNEYYYEAINGKKYLLIHGDMFDHAAEVWIWLSRIGSKSYEISINVNSKINWIRKKFGYPPWSFALNLKRKVKGAVSYVNSYEKHMIEYCEIKKCDGVICGHVHIPEMRLINKKEYMNCGDWVESLTALVEDYDGTWKIINWKQVNGSIT